MAKINFDPELVRNIKSIYGDADLDDKTLKQLYLTWQTNPDIIRNTAQQKTKESYFDSPELYSNMRPTAPSPQVPENIPIKEVDYNDLSMVQGFNEAFKIALNRGLKQFKWKSTKANPSGLFKVEFATNKQVPTNPATTSQQKPTSSPTSQSTPATQRRGVMSKAHYKSMIDKGFTWDSKKQMWNKPKTIQSAPAAPAAKPAPTSTMREWRWTDGLLGKGVKWSWNIMDGISLSTDTSKLQQGGTMQQQQSSQEQELQKAFLAYLIQDAAQQGIQLQSEQDLQAYAEQLGEEGIKAKYQEFMQKMQGGMMARLGAKLEYYKKLKGVCPEGQELVYFKQGGRVCKACQKSQQGTKVDEKANAVAKFKDERAQKKNINKDACGSKMKSSKRGSKKK